MKKAILIISLSAFLAVSGLTAVLAQDEPDGQRDSVNMDTDAVPTFYYDIEDDNVAVENEKSPGATIGIVVGVVVLAGAIALFLLRKKK
jgi:hypothetical protein